MKATSKPVSWRDRVVELRRVPAAELAANPQNFREHPEHQRAALRGILDEVGIAGTLLAYNDPEWGLTLIDGHARTEEGGEWPVVILDVDRAEANLLLATHDPIGALATTNAERLEELLHNTSTGVAAVQQLLDDMATKAGIVPPAVGDVDTSPANLPNVWGVIIECRDEAEQVDLLDRFAAEGLTCRAVIS